MEDWSNEGSAHQFEMNEVSGGCQSGYGSGEVALASLLPVLWLMASGQDLAIPVAACPYGQARVNSKLRSRMANVVLRMRALD